MTELKYASVTVEDLESAMAVASDALSDKLYDVSLIYTTYSSLVNKSFCDADDDLTKLCDILHKHDFFAEKNVYIESFTSFTGVEHKVIERMFATAKNVIITIPLPTPDYSDISTASIEQSYKILKKNALRWGGYEKIILPDTNDRAEDIKYLADTIWNLDLSMQEPCLLSENILLEQCDSPYSECQAVASHILELLRNGERCRDIAIIARNADKYTGIIDTALEYADIPFFMSEKTDVCTLAPIKFILTALRIHQYNWRRTDVISHIKTGLCDIDTRDCDLFEEYINTWNISGNRFTDKEWCMNPDGFSDRMSKRGKEILSCANKVRNLICDSLVKLFIELEAAENVAQMCIIMYNYIESVALYEKIQALAKKELSFSNRKGARELMSSYDVIVNSLANIGEAIGDTTATVGEFYNILKTVFDNTDIGTIPTGVDEVTIGSAATLRTADPKFVFVLGLCEGEFPANVDDIGIFCDTDRESLSDLGIELDSRRELLSSDELMFIKNAFYAPRKKLYLLTHTHTATGESRSPSLAFIRVQKIFKDLSPHQYSGNDLSYLAGSPKSAAARIRNISDPSDKLAVSTAVSEHLPLVATLSDQSTDQSTCKIDPQLIKNIVGDKLTLSPSSLEKYVRCPMGYFATNFVSLREPKRGYFQANTYGSFIHYVMEHMISLAVPSDKDAQPVTDQELKQNLDAVIDQYIRIISPDDDANTKRIRHLYKKLKGLSILLLQSIIDEFHNSNFRPMFYELKINGHDGNPDPLDIALSDGTHLNLRGVVDRVDIWKKDEHVYIRVVDYKTGSKEFKLSDIAQGLNTQMLIYLFAICASPGSKICYSTGLSDNESPMPAGVVYLSSAIPTIKLKDHTCDEREIKQNAQDKIVRSGLVVGHSDILEAMSAKDNCDKDCYGVPIRSVQEYTQLQHDVEETLKKIGDRILSGVADADPIQHPSIDPCKYCEARPICRKSYQKIN